MTIFTIRKASDYTSCIVGTSFSRRRHNFHRSYTVELEDHVIIGKIDKQVADGIRK